MFKFDFLRLGETELAGDVGNWLLREHDGAGMHRPDGAGKLNVFDGLGKELQTAAVLFEEAKTRAIDLAINEQPHEPLVAQAGRERKFALRDVERRLRVTQPLVVETRHIFKRRVAHRSVIAIDIESSHQFIDWDGPSVQAREAGDSIKPGAQAPGSEAKKWVEAREAPGSAVARFAGSNLNYQTDPRACALGFMLSPASRARTCFLH